MGQIRILKTLRNPNLGSGRSNGLSKKPFTRDSFYVERRNSLNGKNLDTIFSKSNPQLQTRRNHFTFLFLKKTLEITKPSIESPSPSRRSASPEEKLTLFPKISPTMRRKWLKKASPLEDSVNRSWITCRTILPKMKTRRASSI